MLPLIVILLLVGAIGHAVLWVAMVNRLHALGIERRWVDLLTMACGVAVVTLPVAVAWIVSRGPTTPAALFGISWAAAWSYVAGCVVVCVVATIQRLLVWRHPERSGTLVANHTANYKLSKATKEPLASPGIPNWLTRLPLNQALDISVHEKQLAIPRLAPQHEGLRIAHLSDLHMSGRITKVYFEHVVAHVNRCQPDLVAITGDLVERTACLDWIPDTLGRLQAPAGVYYVLGNHDRHISEPQLHAALQNAGLIHVGRTWREIEVCGAPLILAGNELPWYRPAPDLSRCPPRSTDRAPLRILLAHSPDQFGWAKNNDIDLMLAGHNHGGQVRLPVFGAILAPSLHGVRYASGAFRAGTTVMHVSRGTSCLTPVRYNCPPEIALLILCAGN